MIIVLKPGSTKKQIQEIVSKVRALDLDAMVSTGVHRTIIGVIGEGEKLRVKPLEAIPFVEKVVPIMTPYKLASREFRGEDTIVKAKGAEFGGPGIAVIAGPCAVENRDMLFTIAAAVKEAGACALRGGAFKPRTSPYSFHGLGEEGLRYLRECGDELNMPIVTEVIDTKFIPLVEKYADVLQIGARNMQSFNLLTEAGKTQKPVLLKRGMSATVSDLLLSAEYILSQGNSQVILCERGIRTFEDSTRNTVDISAVAVIQQASHLPVIVDPSHGTGRKDLIAPVSRAAIAAGANGLMIEVHHCPQDALCDGEQALLPDDFGRLMQDVSRISQAIGKQAVAALHSNTN